MLCTAHHKRTGQPCKKHALHGTTVCREHGGKGILAAPRSTLKHGKYSKTVPGFLQEAFAAYLADPGLTKLDRDIALCRALFDAHLSQWQEAPSLDARTAEHLIALLERLSVLVERHVKIEYLQRHVVTTPKLAAWMQVFVHRLESGMETHITDAADRQRFAHYICTLVGALGLPEAP